MTKDRITSEEKRLWIEGFKLIEPLLLSAKRTKALYKKYGQMVNGEIDHTIQDLLNIESQFFNSKEMTERLMSKSISISTTLVELNPNFKYN